MVLAASFTSPGIICRGQCFVVVLFLKKFTLRTKQQKQWYQPPKVKNETFLVQRALQEKAG